MVRTTLILISLLTALIVKAQPPQFDTKKLDYNYTLLSDTVKSTLQSNSSAASNIKVTFYPDSVPAKNLFVLKKKHVTYSLISKGKHYDSVIVANPWVKNFPNSQYRVLTIHNTSAIQQKIFYYSTGYNPTGDYSEFYLDKIVVFMEAKDEKGKWKEIKTGDNLKIRNVASRKFLRPNEQMILIVKALQGGFETDIRFKLMINEPPDFHMEEYIYSNVFKGRIDKSNLEK